MKVLCCYKGTYPQGMAMAKRLYMYAKICASIKFSFTVFSEKCSSKQHKGKPFDYHSYIQWKKKSVFDSYVIIRDLYSSIYRLKLFLLIFKAKDYDIIFTSGYKWPTILCFKFICLLTQKKLVIELNELPYSLSKTRFSFLNKINSFILFNFIYKLIDGYIVISQKLFNVASKYKKTNSKVFLIPILINSEDKIQRIKNTSTPFIFHAGTLNDEKDGIIEVFKAFGNLKSNLNTPIKFILSNSKMDVKTNKIINQIIDDYDMKDNIIFHNYLTDTELRLYYQKCIAVVINRPNTYRNSFNFSTKLGESLFYSIPVITTNYGESRKYLIDGFNCLIIDEKKPVESISNHIYGLISNKYDVNFLTQNGQKQALDCFDYKNFSDDFKYFILSL